MYGRLKSKPQEDSLECTFESFLAPKCQFWSSMTFYTGPGAFGLILSPLEEFGLIWRLRVGPTYYQNGLNWKFQRRHLVRNVKFYGVVYFICVHGVSNESQ